VRGLSFEQILKPKSSKLKLMIYLDYNATAPMRPEVKAAMLEVIGEAMNPSSIHASGRKARKLVEGARQQVLQAVNAENLIFCASGTEANNLALSQADSIAVSAIEHDSVYKFPGEKVIINVTAQGIIDLADLKSKIENQKSKIVSVMLANNETGIIQRVAEVAEIAHGYGALVHCDAVQGFGKIPLDFKALGVDMMTVSSHKTGGPVGAAALIHKPEIEIKPLMFGGGQEKNKRPGTENVAAIVGFGEITKYVPRGTSVSGLRSPVTEYLESEIRMISSDIIIFGENTERLPNTSCIAMPGVESAVQLIHFDTNGICISTGAACSSGRVEVSRVLKSMGAGAAAKNAIRISTGWATTRGEIDRFVEQWRKLYHMAGAAPLAKAR